jgi:hypothetical protein
MAEKASEREKVTFRLEMLTDARARVFVGRTIQPIKSVMDFSKFEIELEGNIPDGANSIEALDELFRRLTEFASIKEAAIRATHGNPARMDELTMLLKSLLTAKGAQVNGEPPI